MPQFDPSKFGATDEQSLPPGTYLARILTCEEKVSKTSGNSYLNWKFETISENPAWHKRWVYMATVYNKKGAERFAELARAVFGPSYNGGSVDTATMLGKQVCLQLGKDIQADGSEGKYMRVEAITSPEDNISF